MRLWHRFPLALRSASQPRRTNNWLC